MRPAISPSCSTAITTPVSGSPPSAAHYTWTRGQSKASVNIRGDWPEVNPRLSVPQEPRTDRGLAARPVSGFSAGLPSEPRGRMEGQLNLLSRPRGTGSAGAGRAREDLDFITRLLGVGLRCLAVPVVSCMGIPLKHQRICHIMTYVRDRAAINLQKLEQGSQTVQRFLYFLQTRCKKLGPFYINTRKLYFLTVLIVSFFFCLQLRREETYHKWFLNQN